MFTTLTVEDKVYDIDLLKQQSEYHFEDPYNTFKNIIPFLKIVNMYCNVSQKIKNMPNKLFNDFLFNAIYKNLISNIRKNRIEQDVRELSLLLDFNFFKKYGYNIEILTPNICYFKIQNNLFIVIKNIGLYQVKERILFNNVKEVLEHFEYKLPQYPTISEMMIDLKIDF